LRNFTISPDICSFLNPVVKVGIKMLTSVTQSSRV